MAATTFARTLELSLSAQLWRMLARKYTFAFLTGCVVKKSYGMRSMRLSSVLMSSTLKITESAIAYKGNT